MKNDLKEIADKIIELENSNTPYSNSALEKEMGKLIENLSFSDLMEIDSYILESNKLKK